MCPGETQNIPALCVPNISRFVPSGNYVIQVKSFFGSLCVFLLCMCVLVTRTVSVILSFCSCLCLCQCVLFSFSVSSACSWRSWPCFLRDVLYFLGDRCVISLTPGLCMWEMCQRLRSPAIGSQGTLPHHPAPPLPPKRECSDARAP